MTGIHGDDTEMGRLGSAEIISLKTVRDHRGALSVAERGRELPFDVKRIYILHELDGTALRGAHAHKRLRQVMIAMSGTSVVKVDNGVAAFSHMLDRPDIGLLLEPVVWREIEFSKGAVLAVLASEVYDADDYIKSYSEFKTYMAGRIS